ncbi:MAG: thioesterase family protein [Gemmatimonadota bacterium]
MTPTPLDPTLADPSRYRYWHPVVPRFRDLDMLGHINHVNLIGWLEDARVAFELPIQPVDQLQSLPVMLLAEIRVRFMEEVHFDDPVRVGLLVQRLGRSSVVIGQAVFAGDTCGAIAEVVEVLVGQESRAPEPLPPAFRALFEPHLRKSP